MQDLFQLGISYPAPAANATAQLLQFLTQSRWIDSLGNSGTLAMIVSNPGFTTTTNLVVPRKV